MFHPAWKRLFLGIVRCTPAISGGVALLCLGVLVARGEPAPGPAAPPAEGEEQREPIPLDPIFAELPEDPPLVLREARKLPGERDGRGFLALAFSPDGKMLASSRAWGFSPTDIVLWDLAAAKRIHVLTPTSERRHMVTDVAFLPPGDRLVTDCYPLNKTFLWDVKTGKLLAAKDIGTKPAYSLRSLAAFPDGKRVLCCAYRTPPIVWDVERDICTALPSERYLRRRDIRPDIVGYCDQVVFAQEGSRFFTTVEGAFFEPAVLVWNATTMQVTRIVPIPPGRVLYPACSPSGDSFAGLTDEPGSLEPHVGVWDAATGERRFQGPLLGRGTGCLAFTSDGKYLLAGLTLTHFEERPQDWFLGAWDLSTGRLVARVDRGERPVHGLAVSPDGKLLAVAASDVEIYTINVSPQAKPRAYKEDRQ